MVVACTGGKRSSTGFDGERTPARGLFRRVVLINGLVFTLGTLVLAMSPARVSTRIQLAEIPVLVVGLAIVVGANALLLRSSLAPGSARRVNAAGRSAQSQ